MYKKYPFKLYDKKGKQIDLILTEKEHNEFIDNLEIAEEIAHLNSYLWLAYGVNVHIEVSRGNNKLEVITQRGFMIVLEDTCSWKENDI